MTGREIERGQQRRERIRVDTRVGASRTARLFSRQRTNVRLLHLRFLLLPLYDLYHSECVVLVLYDVMYFAMLIDNKIEKERNTGVTKKIEKRSMITFVGG